MKKLTLLLLTALSLLSITAQAQEEVVNQVYRASLTEIATKEIFGDQLVDYTMTVYKNTIKMDNKAQAIYIVNPKTKKEFTAYNRKYIQYDFVDEENVRGYLRFSQWNDGDKTLTIHYQDILIMYWYR